MIYIWKIFEVIVPKSNNQIVRSVNGQRGRRYIPSQLLKTNVRLQTYLSHSFIHDAPKLFYRLPIKGCPESHRLFRYKIKQ